MKREKITFQKYPLFILPWLICNATYVQHVENFHNLIDQLYFRHQIQLPVI